MSRPGVVFSREQLLDAVWGHDRAVTDRTVDVYVLRLRQKIEQPKAALRSSAASAASAIAFNVEVAGRSSCSRLTAASILEPNLSSRVPPPRFERALYPGDTPPRNSENRLASRNVASGHSPS